MVGEVRKQHSVEDILNDSQICLIVKKCVGETASFQLVGHELAPAAAGIAGFLGDHFRLSLTIKVEDRFVKLPLFVKSLPLSNSPKASFIDENDFFRREAAIFKLMEEIDSRGSQPWVAKAYLYNPSVLVMRDLAPEGYSIRNQLEALDLAHQRAAMTSVARFHAAVAGHEVRRSRALARPFSIMEECGHLIVENNFKDTPWIAAGAKLAANLIQAFSDKYRNAIPGLEEKLRKQFVAACGDLTERKDTLNVLLHKDLWGNNIMFKYEDGVPTNAILVDFQCVRYGPPAFDVIMCWYCTTDRKFREQYESEVIQHYFDNFTDALDDITKEKLKGLGYGYEEFLRWIEMSRRFGLLASIMLYPYVLLDQHTAQEMFDDPETFLKYTNEDRSQPVLAHARRCSEYRRRQLEVCEEFVERYLYA